MYTGKATISTPSTRTACAANVSQGRFSTICSLSIMHPALDEAELEDREGDYDCHEHHRLRRRAAEIERAETIVVDLEHENFRCLGRAALRHGMDDPEGLEEGVDDVHHQQEEHGR